MTIGSILRDDTYLVPDAYSSNGYYLAGNTFSRVWSGADRVSHDDLTPHNYAMSQQERFNGQWVTPSGSKVTVVSGYGWGADPTLSWSNNDSLKLLVKLGSRIRDHDFNASIFLAEADQSIALIGDTATRLAKGFHALKSGHLYKAASLLADRQMFTKVLHGLKKHLNHVDAFQDRKRLANAILEVQYGWRPLLSDAESAGTAMAALLSRPPRETYSATRKIQLNLVTANGPHVWACRKTISQKLKATVVASPSWREQLRLGNIAQAISNRTPWSFVANWFLPFEDYLEARSTITDLHINRLLLTTKTTSGGVFHNPFGGHAFRKEFSFHREVLTINPDSPTQFANSFVPLPNLKPLSRSLSWEHTLNGIALLNGVVERYRY